jgi:hypothetical protein
VTKIVIPPDANDCTTGLTTHRKDDCPPARELKDPLPVHRWTCLPEGRSGHTPDASVHRAYSCARGCDNLNGVPTRGVRTMRRPDDAARLSERVTSGGGGFQGFVGAAS